MIPGLVHLPAYLPKSLFHTLLSLSLPPQGTSERSGFTRPQMMMFPLRGPSSSSWMMKLLTLSSWLSVCVCVWVCLFPTLLSVCLSIYVFPSSCLSVFMSFHLHVFLSSCLSIYVFISSCISIFMSYYLQILLSVLSVSSYLSLFHLSVFLPIFLFICCLSLLSICLFAYLFSYLSLCLPVSRMMMLQH